MGAATSSLGAPWPSGDTAMYATVDIATPLAANTLW